MTTLRAPFTGSAISPLAWVLCGTLCLDTTLTHGGVFYDGPVTIVVNGGLYAEGSWSGGGAGVNFNVAALQLGGAYVADGFDESTRNVGMSDATYVYTNTANALISGELKIGAGNVSLVLHAEASTSASMSSADHKGVTAHNNTPGGVSAWGKVRVTFPSLTAYSIRIDNPGPDSGGRYIESTGSTFFKEDFDSADASSFTSTPAGVPGPFNDSDSASAKAGLSITILYGPGATRDTAILPSGPSTHSPGAASVAGATLGSTGPRVSYRSGSTETFSGVSSGRWFDPPLAYGFVYEAIEGTLFTEIINFPTGFSGAFSVWSEGAYLGHFRAGDFLRFEEILGHGVSAFTVLGITPESGEAEVTAFPIQLEFDAETGSFHQHALEPVIPPTLLAMILPSGETQLHWTNALPCFLEQSPSLAPDSWLVAPDQGEADDEGEHRLILEAVPEPMFFRLNFVPPTL